MFAIALRYAMEAKTQDRVKVPFITISDPAKACLRFSVAAWVITTPMVPAGPNQASFGVPTVS